MLAGKQVYKWRWIELLQLYTSLTILLSAFIDTEGTFRPERIVAIANRFGVDSETALQNISVGRAGNSGECRILEFW